MAREEIENEFEQKNSELKKVFENSLFTLRYQNYDQTLLNYNKVELVIDVRKINNLYFSLPVKVEAKDFAEELLETLKKINFDEFVDESDSWETDDFDDEEAPSKKKDDQKIIEKNSEILSAVKHCKIGEYLQFEPTVSENQDVLVIPSEVKVLSLKHLYKFKETIRNIKKIVFEGENLEIDERFFSESENLEEVVFKKEMKYLQIGESAFEDCEKLTTLVFENEKTGQNVFMEADVFKGTKLPDCTTEFYDISDNIFYDKTHCYSIQGKESDTKKIVIPEGITWIGREAFKNWSALEEVILPESIKKIRHHSFEGCKNLKKIKFPEGLVQICESAFKDCTSLEEIEFGSQLVDLGPNAFRGCENLVKADLSKITANVKLFGNLFYGCKKLKEIYIPDNCIQCYGNTFKNSGIEHFEFSPDNKKFELEKQNEGWILFYTDQKSEKKYAVAARGTIVVPDEMTTLPKNYLSHTDVQKVILSEKLEIIPLWCFQNTFIEEFVIPDNVKYIGDYVLWDNPNLKRLVIGKNVEEIEFNKTYQIGACSVRGQSFNYCPNLKEIVVHPENKNFRFEDGNLYAKKSDGTELKIFSVDFKSIKRSNKY